MSTKKPGMRVGVLTNEGGAVYGTYNGDLPCPMLGGVKNPNITLDDGTVVWGCQVWWGEESKVRAHLEAQKE